MFFSQLADIQSAFESFFVSVSSSITFNLLFFIGIGIELFLVVLFSILNRFSYEGRTRRALDSLNRWLFKHKALDKDNIKEFSNLIKKAPKRLVNNWQQYILYREKAPSEYMNAENIVEKPLRTSSFASNLKSFVYISIVWSLIIFVFGIAYQNLSDTLLNATMVIVALIVPVINAIICTVSAIIMRARKNVNLDELYQNLHLFDRFIDNACIDLPPYIDYSLLFTAHEIDRGIPALREYLEARARKEKEEFEKIAEEDAIKYEKYDFKALGIDGQNILERAMKESESYITKRDKTMAQIAQIEASLESLKRNFENIQKDFQKKMQVYKENIDRLRQQQEETTNRIESNFLRKQQAQEITKQEKEQADFEQQQRRYMVEKSEYEDVIKSLHEEMNGGRAEVEKAMMSEYESFYSKLYNTAVDEAEARVKTKLGDLTNANQTMEEALTMKESQLKRVVDENETLKRKLGIETSQIEEESAQYLPLANEQQDEQPAQTLVNPQDIAQVIKEKSEQVSQIKADISAAQPQINQVFEETHIAQPEETPEAEPEQTPAEPVAAKAEQVENNEQPVAEEDAAANQAPETEALVEEYQPQNYEVEAYEPLTSEEPEPEAQVEEAEPNQPETQSEETAETENADQEEDDEDYDNVLNENDFDFGALQMIENQQPSQVVEEKPAQQNTEEQTAQPNTENAVAPAPKRRGRPRKGEEKKLEDIVAEKRSRGRPRKPVTETVAPSAPKKRGRPVGSTKKPQPAQPVEKRKRGRPKKTTEQNLQEINKKIDDEQKRLSQIKDRLDGEIQKALQDLDTVANEKDKRDEIMDEITSLKESVHEVKNSSSQDQIEDITKKIEQLLEEIKKINK